MKYAFKDIYNSDMYNKSSILFVTGPYALFNNIAVDSVKELCNGEVLHLHNSRVLKQFEGEDIKVSNAIDFENFKLLCRTPSITGKWYTVLDMDTAPKKSMEWVREYMKNPSEFSLLCLTSTQYKNYKFWLGHKIVNNTSNVNLIQLSWPYRDSVISVASAQFLKRNRHIEPRALDLFIVRMGNEYDEYDRVIDKICNENTPLDCTDISSLPPLSYEQVLASMKGIESYGIDEFIERLTVPLTSDMISSRKLVYRMLFYLIDSYGARKLLNIIKSKIDDLVEYRMAINDGTIPILVDFSPAEAKKALGDESRLANKTDYRFKTEAKLASRTSLNDWIYMSMIVTNARKTSDFDCYEALYNLVSRSILNDSRLSNATGKSDIYMDRVFELDKLN